MSDINVSGEPSVVSTPAPATSAPSAAPTPATPSVGFTPQAATQPAAPTGATSGVEDRTTWVPPYRLRETREAALREAQNQWTSREREYQSQLERIQSQLHALVGVSRPQDPQIDAVKQQFSKLFPSLAKLEERGQDVLGLLERAGDLEQQTDHYWQTYGRQSMDRLFSLAHETLGAPLTEEAKRNLHASFVGFVQSSPEMTARYSQDPTLVEEYWRAFSSSFIDPVRRASQATVTGRAAQMSGLPQDTPGGAPRATPVPKPSDMDERAAMAWAQYQTTAKPQR